MNLIFYFIITYVIIEAAESWLTLHHSYFKNYTHLMMGSDTSSCELLKKVLSKWQFSEPKLLDLPLDDIKENYVRRHMKNAVFSKVLPTPLTKDLKLVAYSKDALINILDMNPAITETQEFSEFVAGNRILESSTPMAHRYGGHQFGVWAMQLGDGRAHLLGEYINSKGEHWELQLKGSGMTPYSRDGDGRAVLRSSIREFLCSEAMYYLGVPTSRAAALVVSRDPVQRDQFYNGSPRLERAAVVLRLAPTWFRFGSLELPARFKERETLRTLTDFIVKEHFPGIPPTAEDKYVQLFSLVAHETIDMVVLWQAIGFTHGVLNTDNMSLLSITIDYGPFGFLDTYRARFVPNSSDDRARYCYAKQLEIALWNLDKLAEALSILLDESQVCQMAEVRKSLEGYSKMRLSQAFRRKLGLATDRDGDLELSQSLLELMERTETDFTMGFRQLGEVDLGHILDPKARRGLWALETLAAHDGFAVFVEAYRTRAAREEDLTEKLRQETILRTNPRYVLRNWMAQSAISAAEKDDFSEVQLLMEVLTHPYTEQEVAESKGYASTPPSWAGGVRVSCSS